MSILGVRYRIGKAPEEDISVVSIMGLTGGNPGICDNRLATIQPWCRLPAHEREVDKRY